MLIGSEPILCDLCLFSGLNFQNFNKLCIYCSRENKTFQESNIEYFLHLGRYVLPSQLKFVRTFSVLQLECHTSNNSLCFF